MLLGYAASWLLERLMRHTRKAAIAPAIAIKPHRDTPGMDVAA